MSACPNVSVRALVGWPPLLAALLAGCGAGHDADCFKGNGPVTTQRRTLSRQLRRLVVYDNVDVTLVPDTASYAEVRAGENVIDDIELTTPGGPTQLVIHNTSRCNWVRSYNTPREVRLHLPHLREIIQQGYGLLGTASPLVQDTLFVRQQSTGAINLHLQAVYVFADLYDAGDLTLSGTTQTFLPNLGSNGFLFASGLQADYCYFTTYPTWVGDAHVQAHAALGGVLKGSGTLYYTGRPPYLDVKGPNASRLVAE